jgi:hypothetical protein
LRRQVDGGAEKCRHPASQADVYVAVHKHSPLVAGDELHGHGRAAIEPAGFFP